MLSFLFGGGAKQPDNVAFIDGRQAMEWVKAGEAIVIDVRETGEYAAEHIPGSVSVPLSTFDPAKVPDAAGKKLIFQCRSGNRCGPASAKMAASGYEGTLYRMQGGIGGWKSAGGATEK